MKNQNILYLGSILNFDFDIRDVLDVNKHLNLLSMSETLMIAKEYAFDHIVEQVYLRLKYIGYDPTIGYDITFDPELEIYAAPLVDLGYDMNDDETPYFDENGRPNISPACDCYHWLGDLSMVDEKGVRVPNVEYIKKVVDDFFSRESLLFFTN